MKELIILILNKELGIIGLVQKYRNYGVHGKHKIIGGHPPNPSYSQVASVFYANNLLTPEQIREVENNVNQTIFKAETKIPAIYRNQL